jgi:hypothetical protein
MHPAIHRFTKCLALLAALAFPRLAAQSYIWRNAEVGGGGFVTGTVFHPTEPGLVYTRTDVGGIYRLDDTTRRWIPLNDQIGGLNNEFQHLGVLSIGLDPNDPNRIYIATGQYGGTESWKLNSRIYRSTDRGNTWLPFVTPGFKMAGNGEGRGTGERIAVDPVNGANLLVGTSDAGIWRSTNSGASWARLPNFPSTLTHLNFLLYAPANHASPGPGRRVYAAANTLTGQSFWCSDNNGDSWTEMPGHPGTAIGAEMMPLQGSFDAAGVFYSTWGDATGPGNFATDYGVWKLSADATTWTSIRPPTGQGFFSGISADPRVAGHVVVSTLLRWWPGDEVYRSTNGGSTWTAALRSASRSAGNSPWAASATPHWITDMDLDPFDSERAIFNTGLGLFESTNLSASGTTRLWTFFNDGLEELVPLGLLSPTAGPPLVSVTGDYTGWRHDDLNRSPLRGRHNPGNGSNGKIAGAPLAPEKMIRQNSTATYFSQDAAATWAAFPTQPPTAANGHGTAILSANGQRVLWCPTNSEAYRSTDSGATWTLSNGTSLAGSLTPIADSVNGELFYLWNNTAKTLLRSTDGGLNFTTAANGTATTNFNGGVFRSVPQNSGHLWVAAGGNGLHKSTNSGSSFTKFPNITAAYRIAFGRAAPGASHPAAFLWGTVSGVSGFFRSDNAGSSWTRINDHLHQFGYQNDLAADPRVYGRVYLATSGRGVVIGEIATTPPASQPTRLVYDDAPGNGWSNASAGDTNLAGTSPVFSGNAAISVPAGTGKGVAFTSAPRSLIGFAAVTFRVHGGDSSPPPALSVGISRGGIPLEAIPVSPATAATWQRVIVPLADLGAANIEDLTGLRILSNAAPGAFSIDDIRLAGPDDFIGSPVHVSVALSGLDLEADGAPKAATVTTTPAGVAMRVTYNGSETAPVFPGSYTVAATVTEPNHRGSATGGLILREPELPALPLTAWTSNIAGKVIVDPAAPSSPWFIPDGTTDDFSSNTLQTSFGPITLADTGDKIILSGRFQLSTAGIAGLANWFRFGLFDNRGQAPGIATGWLGYTGMGNSLYERTSGSGLFSTGSGATQRFPDSPPTPIGSSSPGGNPQLAFAVTATRTTSGIVVTHLIQRIDTQAILMRYSYTDTSPNNNGATSGVSNAGTGYSPVFNTAGFAFARSYIATTGATVQFSNVRVTFQSGIAPQAQTLTFEAPEDLPFGTPAIPLTATASSGLPVAFSVISGPATLSGSTLTLTGAGAVTLRASQPGNAGFLAAPEVDRSFQVTQALATIHLSDLSVTYDGSPKTAGYSTVPTGLDVEISYPGNPGAPTDAGEYPVNAAINDANYQGHAADTLVIAPAPQTIDFTAPPDRTFGEPPFELTATSSSGLPVSFTLVSGPASLTGNTVTLSGPGTVTVRASRIGGPNHSAAADVDRSFNVAKTPATITLGDLSATYDGQPKPVTVTTAPALALAHTLTYGGSTTPPSASGSYQVVATITDGIYQGSATGTLVIARRSVIDPVTGWLATNTTTIGAADTSSPLLNSANGSGSNGASVPFFARIKPRVLAAVGDSLQIGGHVTVNTPAGTANQGLWFRFGIFDNPNAAGSKTVNNWLGYTAMAHGTAANSLYERIGGTTSGDFASSIFGTSSRPPDASPAYVAANSPAGAVTLRFDQTITRTAAGVTVISRLARPGSGGAADTVYSSSTFTDTSPNNNGVSNGSSQTLPADPVYHPRYDSVGLVFSGAYLNSTNTSSAQFAGVAVTYTPGTDATPQSISFAPPADRPFDPSPIALTATASSGLPITFEVVSGPATLSGSTLTLTGAGDITLRATQQGDDAYLPAPAVAQTFTVSKAPAASALENWRFTHFETHENTGSAADLADPDSDRIANLMEFALGLDPGQASTIPASLEVEGNVMVYTLTRLKAAVAELDFTVEHSDSLLPDSWTEADVEEVSPPLADDGTLETIRFHLPATSDRRFIRLKVAPGTPTP